MANDNGGIVGAAALRATDARTASKYHHHHHHAASANGSGSAQTNSQMASAFLRRARYWRC